MANENPQAAAGEALPENELTTAEQDYFKNGGSEAEPQSAAAPAPLAAPAATPETDGDGGEAPTDADGAEGEQEQPADTRRGSPKKAIQSLRQREKELEERLKAKDREVEALRHSMNVHLQQMQQAAQPRTAQSDPAAAEAPAIPSPSDDIFGTVEWTQKELLALRKEREQHQHRQQQEQQVNRAKKHVFDNYRAAASEAMQADPNFKPAYDFLIKQEVASLMTRHKWTPEQAMRAVEESELELARDVMRQGRNPAQVIMELAYARDWRPAAQQQPSQGGQDDSAQDQTAQRLETIDNGQRLNKTMTGSGASTSARGVVTAKTLGEMSEADYKAWFAKNGAEGFRIAMTR